MIWVQTMTFWSYELKYDKYIFVVRIQGIGLSLWFEENRKIKTITLQKQVVKTNTLVYQNGSTANHNCDGYNDGIYVDDVNWNNTVYDGDVG